MAERFKMMDKLILGLTFLSALGCGLTITYFDKEGREMLFEAIE
jgi:hypothetical protein